MADLKLCVCVACINYIMGTKASSLCHIVGTQLPSEDIKVKGELHRPHISLLTSFGEYYCICEKVVESLSWLQRELREVGHVK